MANAIFTDNFLTNSAKGGRNFDRPAAAPEKDAPPLAATRQLDDQVDIERARQRLAQASGHEPKIGNWEQALEHLAQLRAQLAADPGAAQQAHRRAEATLVEAATARPAV